MKKQLFLHYNKTDRARLTTFSDHNILVIKHLREINAAEAEGIALGFIRDSLPATTHYLTVITNTSLVTGVFQSLWRSQLSSRGYRRCE